MIIEGTPREQFILAQALTIAIKHLEAVEPPVMREISNIADMRVVLEENLKPFTEDFFEALAQVVSVEARTT